jgi:hypothetical protein
LRSFSKFLKAKLNYNFFHKNATKKNQPTGATNLNPLFSPAIHKFASSRRILLIFSGADRLHFEFEEKYRQNNSEQFLSLARNIDVHIIEMANHILSFMPWQDEMIDKVSEAMKSSDNVPT